MFHSDLVLFTVNFPELFSLIFCRIIALQSCPKNFIHFFWKLSFYVICIVFLSHLISVLWWAFYLLKYLSINLAATDLSCSLWDYSMWGLPSSLIHIWSSSLIKNQTQAAWIGTWSLTHWTTREVPIMNILEYINNQIICLKFHSMSNKQIKCST